MNIFLFILFLSISFISQMKECEMDEIDPFQTKLVSFSVNGKVVPNSSLNIFIIGIVSNESERDRLWTAESK